MGVIAEGIETEDQLAFLQDHDCNTGQGYLFSRPLPAKEFSAFYEKSHLSVDTADKDMKSTFKHVGL